MIHRQRNDDNDHYRILILMLFSISCVNQNELASFLHYQRVLFHHLYYNLYLLRLLHLFISFDFISLL
jgi:hypothetical protein